MNIPKKKKKERKKEMVLTSWLLTMTWKSDLVCITNGRERH
jgi:hypothetical protein